MKKTLTFNTHDRDGNWFAEAIDIAPLRGGGGLAKVAGEMHPEISLFLRGLRKDPRYQYVLMTPMGAFEYWGMNINGDVFPEDSLSYNHLTGGPSVAREIALKLERTWLTPHGERLPPGDWTKFGYKTFEEALRYRHHINKDPSIAYGDIPLAVWNKRMHRVEVIARHDREKAKQVGADEIISDLDEGRPRQISMGCRVKFDVCTKCGHISRTQRDYCDCLRTMMGKVLDDGTIVGAVNFFPNFFDLSDVIVPAGKESGVLLKVAQIGRIGKSGHAAVTPVTLDSPNQLIKTASRHLVFTKNAKLKAADIKKKILPNSGYERALCASRREPDLPTETLEKGDLHKLLSTLALLGIVLRPREFQYAALCRRSPDLASGLRDRAMVFAPRPSSVPVSLSAHDFDPELANMLSRHIPERSSFHPHMGVRVLRVELVKEASPKPVEETVVGDDPLLNKIAEAYTSYRDSLRSLPQALEVAIPAHFGYYEQNFFGDLLDRAMTKTASMTDQLPARDFTAGYLCGAFRNTLCFDLWSRSLSVSDRSPAAHLLGS